MIIIKVIACIWILIFLSIVGFGIYCRYQSPKFKKSFGFNPSFFDDNPSHCRKVKRIIKKIWQELTDRPWKADENDPDKALMDFLYTEILFKVYRRMIKVTAFYGYRIGNGNKQISLFREKIEELRRKVTFNLHLSKLF